MEPRVRPLAAGALRRRLVVEYGPNLPPSWLEQGLAAAFADVAAGLVGEGGLVVAQSRRRLLDAYLPLYLGAEPLIWEVLRLGEAPGREWSRAQGWAVARWLLREPTHRALIDQAFLRAKGELSDEAWEGVRVQALALERAFEEDLRVEVLRGLLEGMRAATRPVDRWEWTDAMRLLANIDVDADAEQAVFVQLVEGTARLLDEDPGTTRFLDAYEGQLRTLVDARSKLQGMRRLKRQVVAELERRGQGYGHPALEEGKGSMGQALQRRFEELGGR